MMETIAWIAVYLVGGVISYLWLRHQDRNVWTVRLRTIAILISLLSWVGVLIAFMFFLVSKLDDESKAKW